MHKGGERGWWATTNKVGHGQCYIINQVRGNGKVCSKRKKGMREKREEKRE